ncbi:MAG: methylmalonyl-CoA mutase family protein [Glycocaulis sp.]
MTHSILDLSGGFPPPSPAEWEKLAQKALAGAPLERLVRRTRDEIARGPLFTRADIAGLPASWPGQAPFIRGLNPARDPFVPWEMRQSADSADPKAANAAILEDLAGGVSAVTLTLDPTGRTGIAVRNRAELETVLDGVMLDLAPVHLDARGHDVEAAGLLLDLLEKAGDIAGGGLGLSALLASNGGGDRVALARRARMLSPKLRAIRVDAAQIYEAAGSEAQELGFALAAGAEAMTALIEAGFTPDEAAGTLEVSLAADTDFHLSIAKLRAIRLVWAQMLAAFGCSQGACGAYVHTITGARMLSARDPWTNLIRAASAGFAGVAGGADALTVRPITQGVGPSNAFARRLARNLHILLAEESHAGKAADPAGGSFLHETLTHRLAEAGWTVFQSIEAQGGASAALTSGWLAAEIAPKRAALEDAIAIGKETLIGVSTFPDLDPRTLNSEAAPYTPPPVTDAALSPMPRAAVPALEPARLAAPYEALRDATDAAQPGPVFIATLGKLADFNARSGFAANRLGIAGLTVQTPQPHETLEDCVSAFKASASTLAIICGTDAAYGDHAADLAMALKAAGAKAVWLAGRLDAVSDASAIDHAIHMRSNALEDGRLALAAMGVTP